MSNIPTAEQSPRIVNGVLKWYQGDTFDLDLELIFTDQYGEAVPIGTSDTVEIVFKDKGENVIKEFSFTNIENGRVTMDFDAVCTALFPKGQYTYDVHFISLERTTIVNDNKAVVE